MANPLPEYGPPRNGIIFFFVVLSVATLVGGSQPTESLRWGTALALAVVHLTLILTLATLGLNTLLNLWWIPRFGVTGAAAATTVSIVAGAAVGGAKKTFTGPLGPREGPLGMAEEFR